MSVTSPHARILEAVKTQLASLGLFQLIDENHSQYSADIPQLAYPAILIDIEDCNYEEAGEGSQFVTSELSFRVLQSNYSQSSQKAPKTARERALSVYELEASVVGAIHGWAPTVKIDGYDHQFTEPFIRVSSRKMDVDDKGLRCREIRFSTAWEETFDDAPKATPQISIECSIIP